MDALDEVKQEIQKTRVIKRRQAETAYNRQMRQAIFTKTKPIPPVKSFRNQPIQKAFTLEKEEAGESADDDKIDIKDLKWEDKEKLLRILFAKMNGLGIVQNYQTNETDADPKVKEIRSYRGAEYPLGPGAFSGSLADRVDRISTIDYSQSVDLKDTDSGEKIGIIESKQKGEDRREDGEEGLNSDVPLFSVPIITMEENEEMAPPIFIINEQ